MRAYSSFPIAEGPGGPPPKLHLLHALFQVQMLHWLSALCRVTVRANLSPYKYLAVSSHPVYTESGMRFTLVGRQMKVASNIGAIYTRTYTSAPNGAK